jgi:hypothetical protein
MPVTRSQSNAGNPRANRPRTPYVALTTIANRRAIEHMIFGGQLDDELKRRNMNDEDLSILRPEFCKDNNPPREKYAELAQRLCLCETFSPHFSRALNFCGTSGRSTRLKTGSPTSDFDRGRPSPVPPSSPKTPLHGSIPLRPSRATTRSAPLNAILTSAWWTTRTKIIDALSASAPLCCAFDSRCQISGLPWLHLLSRRRTRPLRYWT